MQPQLQIAPLRAALSWRLLVAYMLAALIPTLASSLPMGRQLGELLDYVPHGAELARKLSPVILSDTLVQVGSHFDAMQGALVATLLLTLLMAPFAAGLAVAAYPEPPARFFALVGNAFESYGRLFRLMLVALIPLGVAGGIGAIAMNVAGKHAEKAILESSAQNGMRLAWLITIVALLLAELTLEAARAQFAVDVELRSALRAWTRGVKVVLARPGAALGRFLVPTIISLAVASLLAVWRVNAGATLGFVVAQLAVAAIGWGRAGRILALAQLTTEQKRQ
jgi:hypothetical protein